MDCFTLAVSMVFSVNGECRIHVVLQIYQGIDLKQKNHRVSNYLKMQHS